MKRSFGLLLVLVLLIGGVSAAVSAAETGPEPTYVGLTLNGTATAEAAADGGQIYFTFTPAQRGVYCFDADSEFDYTYSLLDASWEWMAGEMVNAGESEHVAYTLEQGELYTFVIGPLNSGTGSIHMTLTQRAISDARGTFGRNLAWELSESGVLTLSGSGAMPHYYWKDLPLIPWSDYKTYITSVVIGEGITSIGSNAFTGCVNMRTISIPNTVTTIDHAFTQCTGLEEIYIPASVTLIQQSALMNAYNMTAIRVNPENPNYSSDESGVLFNKDKTTLLQCPGRIGSEYAIPAGTVTVEYCAFTNCYELKTLRLPASLTSIKQSAFSYNIYSSDIGLREVIYEGTEEQWAAVTVGDYNDEFTKALVHYNAAAMEHTYSVKLDGAAELYVCSCGVNRGIDCAAARTAVRQFACEAAGGVYFLEGQILDFLDLSTGNIRNVYNFPSNSTYFYQDGDLLYWAADGVIIVYDLAKGQVSRTLEIDGVSTSYGIGVDDAGRIFLSVQTGSSYYLNLYTPEGVLLDQMETEGKIYEVTGFRDNGEVYFVGYHNWVYWGYDHNMHCLFCTKVSGNSFVPFDDGYKLTLIEKVCQEYYYEHQGDAALFDKSYLVSKNGNVYDVSGGVDNIKAVIAAERAFEGLEEGAYYDSSNVGVRMVYDDASGTIYAYTSGGMIWNYDPATGEGLSSYQTKHPVFSLLEYGDTLIAVEKEEGIYYIEQFSKSALAVAEATTIDLNETETYKDHTAEEVHKRWAEAYITPDIPVYASEYALEPYTAAVYTQEMKDALVEFSNYLRWLGGLTPFESAEAEVWDNAAKGAVLMTKLGEMTHDPSQPEDMSAEFYEAAYKGCSDSNLTTGGLGSGSAAMYNMVAWLNDTANASNLELGHRFTFLQRSGCRIAYGSADAYGTQTVEAYNAQFNKTGTIEGVDNNDYAYTWPGAGAFPTNAINTRALWSINLNSDKLEPSNAGMTVTITDLDTGEVYDRTDSLGSSAYYGFNDYFGYFYGQCFYFDPPGVSSYEGKNYQVTIGNLELPDGRPAQIVYTINFCKLEHSYEAVVTAPTCTAKGYTTYTCTACGESYQSDFVAAMGHKPGDTWMTDDTRHWYVCTCGEKLDAAQHSYTDDTDASCDVCGYEREVTLTVLLGDVDGSGNVDFFDAMLVLQHYAGMSGEEQLDVRAADVDGSGSIDFFDGMYILQYYAGVIEKLPAQG